MHVLRDLDFADLQRLRRAAVQMLADDPDPTWREGVTQLLIDISEEILRRAALIEDLREVGVAQRG